MKYFLQDVRLSVIQILGTINKRNKIMFFFQIILTVFFKKCNFHINLFKMEGNLFCTKFFSLYPEKCLKFNQSEWLMQNPEQPIRNREI